MTMQMNMQLHVHVRSGNASHFSDWCAPTKLDSAVIVFFRTSKSTNKEYTCTQNTIRFMQPFTSFI